MKAADTFLLGAFFLPKGYCISAFPVSDVFTQQRYASSRVQPKNPRAAGNDPIFPEIRNNRKASTELNALPLGKSAAGAAISLLRGGAETALDLGREGYYLQSLATYGTVTALIMNAALRLYSSTKFPVKKEGDKKTIRYMNSIFTGVTSLCIISGAFTAVLFNVLGIYNKSSLGMANYAGYASFKAATAIYTRWGFRAFLTTCMSFVASFCLSLYARIKSEDDVSGQLILGASIALALLASYHINVVLGLATKFIFTPEFAN